MTTPLLSIKNVSKSFSLTTNFFGRTRESIKALQGVSLDVHAGEILGVVGESGCGKSTMGRVMLRLITPDCGQVHFNGKDITHLSQAQIRKIRPEMQMVFQDPYSSLNPRMTVEAMLSEPLHVHKIVPRERVQNRVIELLEMVGLNKDALHRYPSEFSGGQRQRLGIARALAVNPKIIIADEAVSALDLSVQAQIINLLLELKRKLGLTLVFISHDLKIIQHISDRICVMYLGRVVEIFRAHQDKPLHPYTQALFESIPVADPTVVRKPMILKGEIPSPSHPPSGCVFHTRCPRATESCKKDIPELKNLSEYQSVACDLI